jgi:hypothetical protein
VRGAAARVGGPGSGAGAGGWRPCVSAAQVRGARAAGAGVRPCGWWWRWRLAAGARRRASIAGCRPLPGRRHAPTCSPGARSCSVSGSTTRSCVPGVGRPAVPRTLPPGTARRQASTGDVSVRPQPLSTCGGWGKGSSEVPAHVCCTRSGQRCAALVWAPEPRNPVLWWAEPRACSSGQPAAGSDRTGKGWGGWDAGAPTVRPAISKNSSRCGASEPPPLITVWRMPSASRTCARRGSGQASAAFDGGLRDRALLLEGCRTA